jgi:Concanavalin A-like lectin/glucanases superfamily
MKTQTKKQSVASIALQLVIAAHTENGVKKYHFTWCGLGMWFVMVMLIAAAPLARAQNAYEHFIYPVGTTPGNGGIGWLNPWVGNGALVVSPPANEPTCNGMTPSGNALGPTPGGASSRTLGTPITGSPGTSMVLSAVIWSPYIGTNPSQATLGNSGGGTFIIGDLAEPPGVGNFQNWAIQNAAGIYPSAKPVLANATCLVAQIDFSVSGGMDRMRLWVNPPPTGFLPMPDIDVTTAHVAVFSGVFWQTQNGQTVDEISVTSGPTQALNCVNPPNTTMVAWYPFDETNPSAGMSANLATGNTGFWSTSPPTPIAGKVAGALNFNGISNYVDTPSSIATNFGPGVNVPVWCSGDYSTCQGDFSIDTWINIPSIPSGNATIVDKRSGAVPLIYGYNFFLYNNQLGLQLADGQGPVGYSSYLSNPIPTLASGWNHVAVTVHRAGGFSGIRFYFNGVVVPPVGNPTNRLGSLVNNSPLRIGANIAASPFTNWFLGSLDELEIFNRELSPPEVWSIYNAGQYGKCKP